MVGDFVRWGPYIEMVLEITGGGSKTIYWIQDIDGVRGRSGLPGWITMNNTRSRKDWSILSKEEALPYIKNAQLYLMME